MKNYFSSLAACGFLFLVTSCTAADDKNTSKAISLTKTSDKDVYVEKCGMCHLPNGMGTGLLGRRYEGDLALLENREDLQGAFIEVAVRNGFNTMFPISRAEVSDEQLAAIVRHLTEK